MPNKRAIGIDVGGAKIAAGVVDREGGVQGRVEHKTPVGSEEELLARLDETVEGLLSDDVAAIGFGLPSRIDQRAGRVVGSVHVPLQDVDIRARMRERFSLPVGIDNDANAAAIAEWKVGAGRGARDMVMLTLGTGIGGGLILDGKPYRGAHGGGAELGHMVLQYGGEPCGEGCGGHGHFETLASGSAADRVARELLGAGATAVQLVERARAGEEGPAAALAEIGRKLGAGIGSLVNIFEPELVILGGGFAAAGELLLGPAREVARREALEPGRDLVRIALAELGPEAGVVGAALIGFEAAGSEPASKEGRASE